MLSKRGWRVLEADKIAKRLYAKGKPGRKAVLREFPQVLTKSGSIDRRLLGSLVFSDPKALKRLDAALNPLLLSELRRLKKGLKGRVLLDMATYFKAKASGLADAVVLVDAPLSLRLRRLMARGGGRPRAHALAQAGALRFGKSERSRADLLISNTGSAKAMLLRFERWLHSS